MLSTSEVVGYPVRAGVRRVAGRLVAGVGDGGLGVVPGRRRNPQLEPTVRLWPNGQFSLGYSPAGGMERHLTPQEWADRVSSPLDLTPPSNSHSDRDSGKPRRGSGGMTSYGRKLLRNSVWLMQRNHGKRRLAFCTLTLPPMEYGEFWAVSSNWAEIVRVFYQRLGRLLESRGLPKDYAGCTEMQPGRSEREGVPALHLHFVIVTRRRGHKGFSLRPCELREIWASVVGRYVWGDYCWDRCENMQVVKSDASAYLSKYLSKGSPVGEPPRSDETGWSLPTAWYNVALRVKREVVRGIRRCPALAQLMEEIIRTRSDRSAFWFLEQVVGEGEMSGKILGYYGHMKGPHMRDVVEVSRGLLLVPT